MPPDVRTVSLWESQLPPHDETCLSTCTGARRLPGSHELHERQVSDKGQQEDKDSGSFLYKIQLGYAPPFTSKEDSEVCEIKFSAVFMALRPIHLGKLTHQLKCPTASFKELH